MRTLIMISIFLLSSISLMAQESILGHWNTGQENTVIEIKETDGKMEGRVISSDHPKAPLGKLILKELRREENLLKGKLYSPKFDKWFDASFLQKSNDCEVTIKVGWVERKVNWTKLQ
ncbi:hypothetical protein [Aquiflexum lacus]|uniref:hypothetical protein n=1 Tax=Aquiflexum lacus TaxID=2483805 RepID=UPI001E519B52|nr:hypothetical protein [Aquiflexum lacus]